MSASSTATSSVDTVTVMPLEQVRTISAYGYRLGGPRAWNLHRFKPGDELRTDWYDETDPTHHSSACPCR
jgi:hypothetical protein